MYGLAIHFADTQLHNQLGRIFARGGGAFVMSVSVLCLSASISPELHMRLSPLPCFWCTYLDVLCINFLMYRNSETHLCYWVAKCCNAGRSLRRRWSFYSRSTGSRGLLRRRLFRVEGRSIFAGVLVLSVFCTWTRKPPRGHAMLLRSDKWSYRAAVTRTHNTRTSP